MQPGKTLIMAASLSPGLGKRLIAFCAGLATLAAASPGLAADQRAAPGNDAPPTQHLFGDWGGLRTRLSDRGVDLSAEYTGQVAANVAGGRRVGAAYAQQLKLGIDMDWEKLAGLDGFSTHVILVNRAGRNLSSDKIGDDLFQSQSVYGGAGDVGVHLVQAYGELKLADGRLALAAGRLPVGEDFATSPLYCDFLNTAVCGYPHSLPAKIGFTAFPNSTWGLRVRFAPTKHIYLQTGAYQVRPRFGGRSGFDWGWSGTTGTYYPVELGYEPDIGPDALPGHYKLGAGYDTSDYPDLYYDTGGQPFALTGGSPREHAGRGSAYLLADQMVWRRGEGPDNGLILMGGYVQSSPATSQFTRFAFLGAIAPSPLPLRPKDSIGAVVAWAKIGDALSGTQAIQDSLGLPLEEDAAGVQTSETIFEARYRIALDKGLSLTPDLQYVMRPDATDSLPNALVVALQLKAEF